MTIMCVVAVKYFPNIGWVGAKNRDRNYQTNIEIIQSNRTGIQRLYIDDELTRYTEGLNEYGVCVLSASLSVKSDEKEGDKAPSGGTRSLRSRGKRQDGYKSPDGKKIRDALLNKTPKEAAQHLIDTKLAGCTYIFDEKDCYLLEAGFTVSKRNETEENPRDYIYKLVKIDKNKHSVRTNHGILLPELGYSKTTDIPHLSKSRKSSEMRYNYASDAISKTTDPSDMLDSLSETPNSDKFMNPIRTGDIDKNEMVTTGQLLLVPKERTLHYRPIYSAVSFTYNKLNNEESKTFFEIISSRRLLGFKEFKKVR